MMRANRLPACLAVILILSAPCLAAGALDSLVRKSDLIVFGPVVRVTQGALDADLLKMDVKFRIDTAALAVGEVLKGDPALAGKMINVVFPGFPKPGQPTLAKGQAGLWLLTKSDRANAYEMKTAGQYLPQSQLGAVRRAVQAASGIAGKPKAEDKSAIAKKMSKDLRTSSSHTTRRLAAYRLGELGELNVAPDLVKALGDDNASVRFAADIALRKLTGHRIQVDFERGTNAERQQGQDAWDAWWVEHRKQSRKDILADAVRRSQRPQPDFEHAVAGLAEYTDLNLLPVFIRAFEQSMATKNSRLLIISARYFGRIQDKSYVRKLIAVIDGSLVWTSTSARNAAVAAIGAVVKKDFGSGRTGLRKCLEWWDENRGSFK
jgi:hypothetical protein